MKRLEQDKIAGILITVSLHLAVIIVLMLTVIHPQLVSRQERIELDFSEQEKLEKLERQLAKSKALNEKLDRMIGEDNISRPSSANIKNVSVDASLKDDRGTDAEQLYREAERIRQDYENNMSRKDDDYAAIEKQSEELVKDREKQEEVYSGPSVLSYSLEGRKGSSLPIPAYKCIGEGEVTVIICVDPSGRVVSAKVQEDISSSDKCLQAYALKAAGASRFSRKSDAPARQLGNIVYQFIAQ